MVEVGVEKGLNNNCYFRFGEINFKPLPYIPSHPSGTREKLKLTSSNSFPPTKEIMFRRTDRPAIINYFPLNDHVIVLNLSLKHLR